MHTRDRLDELATLLRPAGGGLYVVSTGLAEQKALQRALYDAPDDSEIDARWRRTLARVAEPETRVVLLAVPSDVGAGFRRGASLAPAALRHALTRRDRAWSQRDGLVDLGDVFVVPQLLHDEMLSDAQRERTSRAVYPGLEERHRATLPVSPLSITERALALVYQLNPRARVLVVGGDHSVAWPAVKALVTHRASPERLAIVQFDAHTDLLAERLGVTYCFATWSYHANDLLGRDGRLVQLGVRASRHDRAHWERTLSVRQFWSHECNADEPGTLDALVAHLRSRNVSSVYLSNDVDGTDPRAIDATGTPEPHGLRPEFIYAVLGRLAREFDLVGGDLCELAPVLGATEASRALSIEHTAGYLCATLDALLAAPHGP